MYHRSRLLFVPGTILWRFNGIQWQNPPNVFRGGKTGHSVTYVVGKRGTPQGAWVHGGYLQRRQAYRQACRG